MDYVELYYSDVVGCYPFNTDNEKTQTQNIIDYVSDAGLSEQEIIRFIQEAPATGVLTPNDLPDWLWNNSLLKRDTFYYHNLLHIRSKAPVFNPVTRKATVQKYFLEMKIRFSMEELIRHFYRTMDIDSILVDYKKDAGSFKYLLDKYARFASFIEPIDFVLAEIDYAKNSNENECPARITNVLGIDTFMPDVFDLLKAKTAEASLANANHIIWR